MYTFFWKALKKFWVQLRKIFSFCIKIMQNNVIMNAKMPKIEEIFGLRGESGAKQGIFQSQNFPAKSPKIAIFYSYR